MNQLADTGYAYDADGNMTTWTAGGVTYTAYYDAENRLYKVTYPGHACYFYYSPDRLVAKQEVDNVETRFVRNGYLCVQERNSSNAVTNAYVWDPRAPGGIGGLLELKQSGAYYGYLYDGRGNVSALIDSNQNVKNSYKYDPFGVRLYASETITQPYQFSTKYYYPGFGGVYYGRRFYLPVLGRWMTRDPIGETGGLNLYGFTGNNSVNRTDFYGEKWWNTVWNAIKNFCGAVISALTPEPASTAITLTDPTLATTYMEVEVYRYNQEQAFNGTPENMINEPDPLTAYQTLQERRRNEKKAK